jgi:hypothetical protein
VGDEILMPRNLRLTEEELNRFVARGAGAQRAVNKATNKFNAQKAEVDGITFDSKHEAERYRALRLEEKAGAIAELKIHAPLQVEINGEHVFTYLCDFIYLRRGGTRSCPGLVYEDAKGYRKGSAYQLFRLKKAVIKAALGIDIDEV